MEKNFLILANGLVLTCDAANRCGRFSLLVRDGRIVDINPTADTLTSLYPGAAIVDATSRLILPGFVNAHFHGESLLLRFLTGPAPFAAWPALLRIGEAAARLRESLPGIEQLYKAVGLSHLMHGTTLAGEFPLEYSAEALAAAIQGISGAGICSVFTLQNWAQLGSGRPQGSGRASFAVSLGREEGFNVYGFENLVRASRDMQCPLSAHIGEQRADVETLRRNFKKSPLRVLKEYGVLRADTHLLHCNHLPEEDLAIVREAGAAVALCAGSAAHKQTGYPLLRHLTSADVRLCLGTDWGSTDVLGEMKFLRLLPRLVPGMPSFSPLELIRMGTINGAYALNLSVQTGSLEIGKKADLIMIPANDIRMPGLGPLPPVEEVAEAVVDYCETGMITDVMTDGVFRIRKGEQATKDGDEILNAFRLLQQELIPDDRRTGTSRMTGGKAVPFMPGDRKGRSLPETPAQVANTGESDSTSGEHKSVNLEHPLPRTGEIPPKMPEYFRKVKKVFGEDDL